MILTKIIARAHTILVKNPKIKLEELALKLIEDTEIEFKKDSVTIRFKREL